ncbi:SH3 domain-binding protein 5 homolog [Onthophagus taurus]|uniref:SH3 domain-binding protein 5 homolog n=1 Tax=Onthophagus taurus TaxID=166361 RepID=UPI000C20A014|nr:SH3 domain-binding protein 5 homolog [Onthophagus taurus]
MEEQDCVDAVLDPRIQIELENLNQATDEINKLEIELDEANTTFRMLLNESTRRLKLLSKKLGSCIEKARPYYDALEIAKNAQLECQKAAVVFRRANEIHAAAKETVALAEQRFLSTEDELQFDNAWQEMLNHATMKVMTAETDKAESGREHQKRAALFQSAEQKVQHLEDRLRRHIIKSRPYFEEKVLCQEQLNTQKDRVESLKQSISKVKFSYTQSMKNLEQISNDIHLRRSTLNLDLLNSPREPGVGAELTNVTESLKKSRSIPDFQVELEKCEINSGPTSSAVSERDEMETFDENLDELKLKVKELAVRPVDGGEGKSTDDVWESELKTTVEKLDHMMLMKECAQNLNAYKTELNNHWPAQPITEPLRKYEKLNNK